MIVEAEQARVARQSPVWGDGVTAPVWAAWFALYARGSAAATEISLEARRKEQPRRGWLWSYHLSIAGMIDQFAGRWDDALTVFEEGASAADGTGTSWVSRVTGGRLQILAQRGLLDEATAGVGRLAGGASVGWKPGCRTPGSVPCSWPRRAAT